MNPRDVARAQAFGRVAAKRRLGVSACPYEANGDGQQRVLAMHFVRAYMRAGGQGIRIDDEDQGDAVPEDEIAARGGAKKWRTVKLPDGRTIRVAVVRKKGKRGGSTVAGPPHEPKET